MIESNRNIDRWQYQDTVWMLSLYGTAVGAGILFLPIDAGLYGLWPLAIMLLLAYPMTHFSHLALCRFVLSGSKKNHTAPDITQVASEHFGPITGVVITILYFFAIFPILLMYSVAITNTTESFMVHQLGLSAPPRALLAFILIMGLMTIIRFGQRTIVKSMSVLVYPFVLILIFLSFYLIPYWSTAIFQYPVVTANNHHGILMTLWLLIPVMVFSFNHSPIISSFAASQHEKYGAQAEKKSQGILKYCHIIMVTTVMFFVMSCVLSLTPADLASAKQQNITILSYLANHFNTPLMAYVAPVIALLAITKSFLGHYLGAKEGLHGLIINYLNAKQWSLSSRSIILIIDLFMIATCWLVATLNPNILTVIESLGGPIIAVILFLIPMYAIFKVPAMQKYQHPFIFNLFTTLIGLIAISAIVYQAI